MSSPLPKCLGSYNFHDMKHHAAVQSARERYISRREEILSNFLRIFSRRLMYRSRALNRGVMLYMYVYTYLIWYLESRMQIFLLIPFCLGRKRETNPRFPFPFAKIHKIYISLGGGLRRHLQQHWALAIPPRQKEKMQMFLYRISKWI